MWTAEKVEVVVCVEIIDEYRLGQTWIVFSILAIIRPVETLRLSVLDELLLVFHGAENFVFKNSGLLRRLLDHVGVAGMMYDLVTILIIAYQHLMSIWEFRASLAIAFILPGGCHNIHSGDVNRLLHDSNVWNGL